jgi:hypothetical protein
VWYSGALISRPKSVDPEHRPRPRQAQIHSPGSEANAGAESEAALPGAPAQLASLSRSMAFAELAQSSTENGSQRIFKKTKAAIACKI